MLFLMLFLATGFGQVTSSPRQEMLRRELVRQGVTIAPSSGQDVKCGTSLLPLIQSTSAHPEADQSIAVARLLQRPVLHTSKLSSTGRFRIHYDTTGFRAPAMLAVSGTAERISGTQEQYVDSVAAIFDQCWDVQVLTMGYQPPPSDGGQGGGDEYDVYIGELGTGEFGSTSWLNTDLIPGGPSERYRTFIEIDNDYLGHRTPGMNGLRVTAAHEFHHAVQLGAYGIWSSAENYDFFFYELSAVWMEDVLFPAIDDYLFDVPSYFQRFRESQTQRSLRFTTYAFPSFFGYERAIFAHFLATRFGEETMLSVWSGVRHAPVLLSIDQSLQRLGTDLISEFALFSRWNYYTADRADAARFYPEGHRYPRYVPNVTSGYNGSNTAISASAYPLSTQFYQFVLPGDTITAVAANVEWSAAAAADASPRSFDVTLSARKPAAPSQTLSKGMVGGFSGDPKFWRILYLESSTRSNANAAPPISPNPLRLHETAKLTIPLTGATGSEAEVLFLSSSLDLVFSQRYPTVNAFGNKVLYVPTADLRNRIAAGIYFVFARCGNDEFRWKVAILQ